MRRIVSLLTAVFIIFSLVACGEKAKNTSTSVENKINLKGAEVVVTSWQSMEPNKKSPTYNEEIAFNKQLEEKYNFKFKFKSIDNWGQYTEAFVTTALSGSKFGDIVYMSSDLAFPSIVKKGYFTALDKYIDFTLPQWNKPANEALKYNSKYYSVTDFSFQPGTGVYFNKAIFSRFGQKTPHDYIAQNNWTWDTFLKLAQALTKDTNSDGQTDIWGAGGYGASPIPVYTLVVSNGGNGTEKQNGKDVFALDSKNAIEAITFAGDLVNKYKIVNPGPAGAGWGYWEKEWKKGNTALFFGPQYEALTYNETLAEQGIGFAYIPKGPKMTDYINNTTNVTTMTIPSAVKNPEEIAKIMEEWRSPQEFRLTDEQKFESWFSDKKSLEISIDMMRKTKAQNILPHYGWYTNTVLWGDMGTREGKSAQAYLASVKAASQKAIDDISK